MLIAMLFVSSRNRSPLWQSGRGQHPGCVRVCPVTALRQAHERIIQAHVHALFDHGLFSLADLAAWMFPEPALGLRLTLGTRAGCRLRATGLAKCGRCPTTVQLRQPDHPRSSRRCSPRRSAVAAPIDRRAADRRPRNSWQLTCITICMQAIRRANIIKREEWPTHADKHASFAMLVHSYHADLLRVAYVVVGDRALAEDAAQATWVRAWEKIDQLRDPSKVRSWLVAVAANEARQIARRRKPRPAIGTSSTYGAEADPVLLDLSQALAVLRADERQFDRDALCRRLDFSPDRCRFGDVSWRRSSPANASGRAAEGGDAR